MSVPPATPAYPSPLRRAPARAAANPYAFLHAGLHLLVAFSVLTIFFPDQGFTLQKISVSSLFLAAVACFIMQVARSAPALRASRFTPVAGVLFTLLFLWCLTTIARGALLGVDRWITLLINPDVGGLVWLLPFAALIGRAGRGEMLASLIPVMRIHLLLGMIVSAGTILVVGPENMVKQYWTGAGLLLLYGAPIFLLTGIGNRYHYWLALTAQALASAVNFMMVARTGLAVSLVILVLGLWLGRARRTTRLRLMFGAFMIMALAWLVAPIMLEHLGRFWSVDTRSFIIEEVSADFGLKDWLVGRGALGTYFSPYFLYIKLHTPFAGGDYFERSSIEIGYLHLVLKGGLVMAGLYFLIFWTATMRALRFEDRRLGDGLALIFLIHLAEMVITGSAAFIPSRLMLWLLAGLALSSARKKHFRQ